MARSRCTKSRLDSGAASSKAAGAGVAYGGAAGSGGAAICVLQLMGQPLQRTLLSVSPCTQLRRRTS
ncbi:unnamed protein product [Pelagomonas calceolata]|uniref:Uncharacterized protein n=1 Tax=Pelagomonas calceolata TaxID=35677 RepID=A0A8J2S620_9STRA|nr:unnamed protein product [Pelagomonas calceolata]